MGAILQYDTPDGPIGIEVDDVAPPAPAYTRKGAGGREEPAAAGGVLRAAEGLEAAPSRVKATADAVARVIASIEARPDAAQVEFALKFTAQAGVVVAKTEAEAQVKVSLTWRAPPRAAGA